MHIKHSFFFFLSFFSLQFEDFRWSKSIFDAEAEAKEKADESRDESGRILAFGVFADLTYAEVLRKGSSDERACQLLKATLSWTIKEKSRWSDFRDWLKLQDDPTLTSGTESSSSGCSCPIYF